MYSLLFCVVMYVHLCMVIHFPSGKYKGLLKNCIMVTPVIKYQTVMAYFVRMNFITSDLLSFTIKLDSNVYLCCLDI